MKAKAKKNTYFLTHEEYSSSKIAENVLHEYSENSEPEILSKSLAYGHITPFKEGNNTLSTWV